MAAPEKFRSALNGFNRDDVVSYLEYINNKNSQVVNRLTSEAEALRSQLESQQVSADSSEALAALEQERDGLRSQLEALRAEKEALQQRCDALERELEEARNADPAPVAAEVSTQEPVKAPTAFTMEEELEIYRRAERTERMARERADAIYRQTNDILGEASLRVNHMTEQVLPIADHILEQLNQLQNTVCSTKQSLQDAVGILSSLQADKG